MARLAVVILNWNGGNETVRCLDSVLASTLPPDKIVVFDNASQQPEADRLEQRFGQAITVLRSSTNLGFTGGNNKAVDYLQTQGSYDYIILLNQDATVAPDCFAKLLEYADHHPQTAVVGPLVLNQTSANQSATIQSIGATINFWTGKIISRYHNQPYQAASHTQPEFVDVVVGNCFCMRSSVVQQLGLFMERYFAYYEEADWCVRARRAGYTCAVVPTAVITHAKSSSFRSFYIARNMIWFQKRWARWYQLLYFFCYYWLKFIPERLHKSSPWSELWRASVAGWLT